MGIYIRNNRIFIPRMTDEVVLGPTVSKLKIYSKLTLVDYEISVEAEPFGDFWILENIEFPEMPDAEYQYTFENEYEKTSGLIRKGDIPKKETVQIDNNIEYVCL